MTKNASIEEVPILPELRLLGTRFHVVQPDQAVAAVLRLRRTASERLHYVSSTNLNTVGLASERPEVADAIEGASLSLPDGVPLLWWARIHGHRVPRRCGIEEVMVRLFELSEHGFQYTHYFYGNTPEVLEAMQERLLTKYPRIKIAGFHSPPFRDLTVEEREADSRRIADARPDFLWVSLGCPKQELWMHAQSSSLPGIVAGGAGAVFDFLAGNKPKAPRLVQRAGLEWLFRLATEPRRLSGRYLRLYPRTVAKVVWRAVRKDRPTEDPTAGRSSHQQGGSYV